MEDMDLIFPSWTQHERIAQALETIALNGATSAAALDAAVQGTVKGKNILYGATMHQHQDRQT